MNTDLKGLEEKVTQLVNLCVALREENQQLREELHQSKHDASRLKHNMLQASNQLEMLLDALPAQEEQE